jgi:hypothetical protein
LALLRQIADAEAVMVDSSKTAWRSMGVPFQLQRAIGEDFRLIHVVRDPRAVTWSSLKKATGGGKIRGSRNLHCAIAMGGWWTANFACELFGWMHPQQYRRIRYEDVARAPRNVTEKLLAWLTPDGKCSFEDLATGVNRHQFHGNRMRKRALSLESVKEDQAWKGAMPTTTRRIAYILSWPLRLKYGYC